MKVIKRDGTIVEYNAEKIRTAIKKANNEVSKKQKATDEEIDEIIRYIEDLRKSRILVEDIQDIIEQKLMEIGRYELAKLEQLEKTLETLKQNPEENADKIKELETSKATIDECGIASRRKCEEYITQGKVQVNGKTITELGVKVNPEKDKITFEGKNVKQEERKVYILLNKPIGYVTTSDEQFGRDKVLDLVKVRERVVPVGRLDMYTSGALILTNDGDFVYKVTHPKHEITKTYTVTVKGIIKNEEVEQLRKGVKIDDYTTRPAKVKILKTDEEKDISRLEITIHEGKNRQVRRIIRGTMI